MKISSLIDVVYPVLCYQCGELQQDSNYLCEPCSLSFKKVGEDGDNFCARCSEPFDGVFSANPVCQNCDTLDYSFEFARSALTNSDAGRALIHDFKYRKQRHLARVLAGFCHQSVDQDERISSIIGDDKSATVIVPVPLHWRRHLHRGFNQAELISSTMAEKLELPHLELLRRNRHTTTQTQLARHERLKNLKGAFSIKKKFRENNDFKQVILVDDVFTTGSTAEACAAVIKKECAKVENIVVVTVLRG